MENAQQSADIDLYHAVLATHGTYPAEKMWRFTNWIPMPSGGVSAVECEETWLHWFDKIGVPCAVMKRGSDYAVYRKQGLGGTTFCAGFRGLREKDGG